MFNHGTPLFFLPPNIAISWWLIADAARCQCLTAWWWRRRVHWWSLKSLRRSIEFTFPPITYRYPARTSEAWQHLGWFMLGKYSHCLVSVSIAETADSNPPPERIMWRPRKTAMLNHFACLPRDGNSVTEGWPLSICCSRNALTGSLHLKA